MGYLYFYLAPNAQEAKKDRDRLVQEIHLYDGLRVDRNISHFGLEARVPFLDEDFVNLYYKIDPELIIPTA
jgi:asparagine synthase (glutamine-hydrolysing)